MGQFPEGEPLLVPLAVPLLAGPSTLAMLILLSSNAPEKWMNWLLAVVADKRRYDLFRKSPETPGRKRTGRRRTVDGDGTCHPFSANVA